MFLAGCFLAARRRVWQYGGKTKLGGRKMRHLACAMASVAAAAVVAAASPEHAQAAAPAPAKPGLALSSFPARNGKTLAVSSPAFKPGGDIPFQNTQYRGNVFPGLSWGKGPYGTRTFVV